MCSLTAQLVEAIFPSIVTVIYLSLAMDVFLNLLIVTESSCNRSQPRRFSAFFNEAGLSDFTAGAFSYTEKRETDKYDCPRCCVTTESHTGEDCPRTIRRKPADL